MHFDQSQFDNATAVNLLGSPESRNALLNIFANEVQVTRPRRERPAAARPKLAVARAVPAVSGATLLRRARRNRIAALVELSARRVSVA